MSKSPTGCSYLDEKKVGASDMGIHLSDKLDIEVTSQDVVNYCIKSCPYDHCMLEDEHRGRRKENV